MPDPVLIGNKCLTCKGDGVVDGAFCYSCIGTGYRLSVAEAIFFKGISDKVDSIIAEQASQREDLTAALTQIWNKVKDL